MKVHITKILLGMLLGIHITCLQNSTSDTSGTTDTTPTTTEAANPDAEVLAIPSLTDVLAVPSAYNDAAVPSLLKMAREDVGGASNFLGLPKMFVGLAENMSSKLLGDLLENLSPVFDAILADNPVAPGEDLLIKITESDGPDYIRLTYNTSDAAYIYNLILYWDNAEGSHCPAIDFSFNLSDTDALTTAKVMVYPAEGPADDGDSAQIGR